MEIVRIDVYRVDIPMLHQYTMSGGRTWNRLDSTVVKVVTRSGFVGWGESCPWGPNYLPGFALGVRAGLEELAPSLIGAKANEIDIVNELMDQNLAGHGYVKHAVDMACWDVWGKSVQLPLSVLLGGTRNVRLAVVASVPSGSAKTMVSTVEKFRSEHGYAVFSCKLSGDPNNDFPAIEALMERCRPGEKYIFDANRGYTLADALRCANILSGYDVVFEQPVKSYEEFAALRHRTTVPLMIDEIFSGMETMWRVIGDKSCEMINLKIAKVGGLSKARLIRDICQEHGLVLSIQCCGGSEITRAAITHLAASTRSAYVHSIWDCSENNGVKVVREAAGIADGFLEHTSGFGLGVEPDPRVLGEVVASYC
ncbi:mandelate racemase/muconate lactonizing enzyme family protein [Desulforhopalus singaporensis]|uniref:L-alanine-DL-glutamate epimerase n=1 Tax=Desulforhopalus singaporensis TaxID=91360 RepID=A0A1H0KI68_9BACT|nr:mandelate racemase/muconate lactonizing enzyme family protein [Desulforhopalus singaporensis]SDO55402.1 L-alanine-DL-glutamate epimerase [Desulforhopalus singaporensis]